MVNVDGESECHETLDIQQAANRFCLFSIQFSPDSNEILGGSSDAHIYIYDLNRREVSHRVLSSKFVNQQIIRILDRCTCK